MDTESWHQSMWAKLWNTCFACYSLVTQFSMQIASSNPMVHSFIYSTNFQANDGGEVHTLKGFIVVLKYSPWDHNFFMLCVWSLQMMFNAQGFLWNVAIESANCNWENIIDILSSTMKLNLSSGVWHSNVWALRVNICIIDAPPSHFHMEENVT